MMFMIQPLDQRIVRAQLLVCCGEVALLMNMQ